MSHYLVQVAYTPEAWATLVKNPQDRLAAIAPAVERLGGRVKDGYLTFGDYDTIAICEFPDDVSAAAFAGRGIGRWSMQDLQDHAAADR